MVPMWHDPTPGSAESRQASYRLYEADPELRWAWREACAAFGPVVPLCLVAAGAGLLLGLMLLPVTLLASCFLRESWMPAAETRCILWPGGVLGWAAATAGLMAAGPLVAGLRRLAARRQWYLRWLGVRVGPSSVAAFGVGLLTGWWWRGVLLAAGAPPGTVTAFATLAGPWAVWWWHTLMPVAWRRIRDAAWLARHVAWLLIWERSLLPSPLALAVSIDRPTGWVGEGEGGGYQPGPTDGQGERETGDQDGGVLLIRGPFDAVDARRWDDLVRRMIPGRWSARTESTLSPEAYWRPYRADLGPSGYISPPIRISWWMTHGGTLLLAAAALNGKAP